jgi:DNA-binding transcriptional ArsR family regulator
MNIEYKYTGTKQIRIVDGDVLEVTDREAFISSSGTAHYADCSVVTRMLSGGGMNRMAARKPVSIVKAMEGIKNGTYADCSACAKNEASRQAEYAENEQLIAPKPVVVDVEPTAPVQKTRKARKARKSVNNTKVEEKTMNNTATATPLPEGVKASHTMQPVWDAIVELKSATTAQVIEKSGVSRSSVLRALKALNEAGAVTVTVGDKRTQSPDVWTLAGAEPTAPQASAQDELELELEEPVAQVPTPREEPKPAVAVQPKPQPAKKAAAPKPAMTVAQHRQANADEAQKRSAAAKKTAPAPAKKAQPLPPTAIGGKQMTVILPWMMEHPGEFFTVKQVEEALGLPDYPRGACFRLVAANVGVEQEKRTDNKLRFGYTGKAK